MHLTLYIFMFHVWLFKSLDNYVSKVLDKCILYRILSKTFYILFILCESISIIYIQSIKHNFYTLKMFMMWHYISSMVHCDLRKYLLFYILLVLKRKKNFLCLAAVLHNSRQYHKSFVRKTVIFYIVHVQKVNRQ